MDLAEYGRNLAQAVKDAGNWVEKNPEIVSNEQAGLLRELRRAGRKLRTCAESAARRTSVGVFGASQAGKSYLVSALASNAENRLIALFGDSGHDFITEINPKNDSESTGLVTRFTMERPKNMPEGFTVQTRLLTELDLVRILANTWFEDVQHEEGITIDLEKELEALKGMAGAAGSGVDLDSLEVLQEYLQNHFKMYGQISELDKRYWPTALELGQKLDLEGRIRLYSLIWDGNEQFTGLLRRLLHALAKIDFATELYCKISALIPREESIINVSTLNRMEETGDEIEVCCPSGKIATLPKPVVTALIAELVIVMKDVPKGGAYFKETDLLDFPGYRSRKKVDRIEKELQKNPGLLYELFLRGKVAYLFQRYCDAIELNNMLLCVGPSNQEVQDLPGVIKKWIASTHGADPAARENRKTSLFFILTKADMDFNTDAGSPSVKERWNNRIKASLLNFFGTTDWTTEWTPGKPFNNLFLLRNPVYEWKGIMKYDRREIGKDSEGNAKYLLDEIKISDDSVEFVEEMHQGFLNSDLARKHFKNLPKSWDALMTLNDGGIGYIRESLKPVCDPAIKAAQLNAVMAGARDGIVGRLKKFYRSDDREELRQQKEESSDQISESLVGLTWTDKLGVLLENFVVSDGEVYEMRREAERRFRERKDERALEKTKPEAPQPGRKFNFFKELSAVADKGSKETPAEVEDEATFYAGFIEEKWVERLHEIAADPAIEKYFGISPAQLNAFVGEMATASARVGLKGNLAGEFRKTGAYVNRSPERIAMQQSVMAARMFNSFVDWLGWNPAREPEKPRVASSFGGESKEVFPAEKPIRDIPVIPDEPGDFSKLWLMDWILASIDMVRRNVDFDGKTSINIQENTALGEILKRLDGVAPKLETREERLYEDSL